ncbi:hypothetical protein [Anaerofustis stercorihominis]|uniref:hypothetical protein n=1 Tax=Anaerofustis stercorihominis TaxID=214853 RepID=UPI003467703F
MNKKRFLILITLIFAVMILYALKYFGYIPTKSYTLKELGIKEIKSGIDKDKDGIDDYKDIKVHIIKTDILRKARVYVPM